MRIRRSIVSSTALLEDCYKYLEILKCYSLAELTWCDFMQRNNRQLKFITNSYLIDF
jgi:hypothetical protein